MAEQSPTEEELERVRAALYKGFAALKSKGLTPRTPCLDPRTLALYVQDEVDEKIKEEINAHLAFCDECYEEYAALVGPEKIMEDISAELNQHAKLAHATECETEENQEFSDEPVSLSE